MSGFTRVWFDCNDGVLEEHSDIEIRQRYCFIFTVDKHVIVVAKSDKKWQFPGGHPQEDETWRETLVREIREETGLDIGEGIESVGKLGYYLIEKRDEKFLQERYILILNREAADLDLAPIENEEDSEESKIAFVKTVPISKIGKYVPWAPEAEGWNAALKGYVKVMFGIG